jgi:hypothetical protein
MTTTPLHQSILAACREEPDEPYHRAALHDLLVDAGHTDDRLLAACLTGQWAGTLAEWLEEGPRVVAMVCVLEDGVRLVDREPTYVGGAYCWAAWPIREVIALFDLPKEWWPPSSVTLVVYRWVRYDSPEAAHLDASRRAVRWAMGEAEKRAKEGD